MTQEALMKEVSNTPPYNGEWKRPKPAFQHPQICGSCGKVILPGGYCGCSTLKCEV